MGGLGNALNIQSPHKNQVCYGWTRWNGLCPACVFTNIWPRKPDIYRYICSNRDRFSFSAEIQNTFATLCLNTKPDIYHCICSHREKQVCLASKHKTCVVFFVFNSAIMFAY